jgi:hypothetical protein
MVVPHWCATLRFRLPRGDLRQFLPAEARLERRDQIGRRRPGFDLDALDLLAGHLLFDCLQEARPVLVLVLLGLELGLRQLADKTLGKRPFLVADLGLGATVDLGRVVDLAGEEQPLEKEPSWCTRIANGVVLPRQVNVPTAIRRQSWP